MTKISYEITLFDELIQPLLQHLRDFDTKHHDQVVMKFLVEAPHLNCHEVERIFDAIKPPFPFKYKTSGSA